MSVDEAIIERIIEAILAGDEPVADGWTRMLWARLELEEAWRA